MKLDQAILERLYYEYAPRMVVFARRMLGDGKIAEDLVQDVFIRLWEKYKGKETDNWHPLIFTMTRNRCLDHLKRLDFKNSSLHINIGITPQEEMLFFEDFSGGKSAVEEDLMAAELGREIESIVKTLSPRCREVFLMSRLHGMQNKEIAQTLGISEKAVEKNMTKALKVLRARLKSQDEKLPSPEILSLLLPIIFV